MATEQATATSYPTSYTTSGNISGTKYRNAIGKGSDTSAVTGNDYCSSRNSYAHIYYAFDFSAIPDGSEIVSVECSVKGHAESTSSNGRRARCQLYVGTSTAKGSYTDFTSTSAQTISLTTGTWTLSEVRDMHLCFTIGYYGGLVNGATATVVYSYNSTTWAITISNSTDVSVTVSDDNPREGDDVEVRSGSIDGISITDNGTDVTAQFTQRSETAESYSVVNVGDYGFSLNSSTGYYVSQNEGISKTAALCRVDFHVPVAATITFTYINYAEQGYDFGVFGNIDVALSDDYYAAGSSGATITDSSYKRACNTSTYNTTSTQTLTYDMSAGDHSIWIKYSKDDASDSGNDTLQFKVAITLDEPFTPGVYWGYDITNVTADHVIAVTKSGPNFYVKLNGSWVKVAKVYRKASGAWSEIDPSTLDPNGKYVRA